MSSKGQIHVPHGDTNGTFNGLSRTAAELNLLVQGIAAGYKLARGVAAGTASVAVATGLTSIVAAVVSPKADTAGEVNAAPVVSSERSGGTLTVYRWKHTGPSTATLVAATTAGSVDWVAIGT